MRDKGRFIVVEGLEGAGKSSAIKFIKRYLEKKVPELTLAREPGGTIIAEQIRTIIKHHEGEILDPRSELLLLYAARVQLLQQVIHPALQRGSWVLADRFELSTFAYQGGGRHLDKQLINSLSKFCLQGFKPDLTLFLDVTPQQGLSRVRSRGALDRIEQQDLAFFNDVYKAYHQAIRTMDNVVWIKADQPLKMVQNSILRKLEEFFLHN